METTFFIIKPEAMKHVDGIRRILFANGLEPHSWKEFTFSEEMLGIYPDLEANPCAHIECKKQMLGKQCLLALITADNAVERLLIVAGHDRNPRKCVRGTIRWSYGALEPIIMANGDEYWPNAIHRPKNLEEVLAHAPLFDIRPADLTL